MIDRDQLSNLALLNKIVDRRVSQRSVKDRVEHGKAYGDARASKGWVECTVICQRGKTHLSRILEICEKGLRGARRRHIRAHHSGVEIQLVDVNGAEQSDAVVTHVADLNGCVPSDIPLDTQIPLLDLRRLQVRVNSITRQVSNTVGEKRTNCVDRGRAEVDGNLKRRCRHHFRSKQ